jgi:hypothetical protein
MTTNKTADFKVNMKEISADKDIQTFKNVFDYNKPENAYTLNLASTYD